MSLSTSCCPAANPGPRGNSAGDLRERPRGDWCDTAATSHLREPDSGSMENVHGKPRNEDTMPQPFKGDRRNITVRMQAADAQKLQAFSDITAASKSDVVARLV